MMDLIHAHVMLDLNSTVMASTVNVSWLIRVSYMDAYYDIAAYSWEIDSKCD